ncbi:hypothetical protein Agub_g6701, partial [Astrephomene gubernaculifera]
MALAGSGTARLNTPAARCASGLSDADVDDDDEDSVGEGDGGALAANLRLHVPVVLSVLRSSAAAAAAFREGWRAVPLGLFLPWAEQMISMLGDADSNSTGPTATAVSASTAVDPLLGPLTALALSYPQRLYAPLRMSWQRFRSAARSAAAPLLEASECPVVGELVGALDEMTYPAQR